MDRYMLIRYFQGECSGEEKERIRQWLEEDEKNEKQFINERIRFDASLFIDENEIQIQRQNSKKRFLWTLSKAVAAVLLLIGSSYLFNLYHSNNSDDSFQHINVPAGSRTSVTLPDGSLVWLNSNTTLSYPNLFSGKKRTVELDGEAYFEVVKDDKKAFIVKTGNRSIEVLGTTFNVEAYAKKTAFKVSLFTGKVKIYADEEKSDCVYLNPGEAAELTGKVFQIKPANTNSSRWKDGLIILENNSFDEIMHLFEKYYDLEIIIRNHQVKNLGYQGKLRIADGIDHALRVLQNDFHFTYERKKDSNVIYIN
ncbi:FecR family protein [Parabacteroides sp. Marseille-P3160]|uniref:FecR family protein n=1 Tax=Parabacteroides sp. Marseille-P3160 TaxID=1917887 RepID=UPI0009B9946B|nr:FecR family protein [Parabacteroides sp. Marseille-P3160]